MQPKPKKRLGQNFLVDRNIINKIIKYSGFSAQDHIFEIGSGSGQLTFMLAGVAKKVYALEIDRNLLPILQSEAIKFPNIEVIAGDFLKFDFSGYLKDRQESQVKVFGNIPYYISSPIIEKVFECRNMISEVFLTVQKEFARRIAARPGSKDYGSFSCFVQYYSEPEILFEIKKNSFRPAPKVDSSFIKIKIRKNPAVSVDDEDLLFKVIRTSFGQRRKTLRNSLKGVLPQDKIALFTSEFARDVNIRPEDLGLSDFARLIQL